MLSEGEAWLKDRAESRTRLSKKDLNPAFQITRREMAIFKCE
jgi:hypothetical protein